MGPLICCIAGCDSLWDHAAWVVSKAPTPPAAHLAAPKDEGAGSEEGLPPVQHLHFGQLTIRADELSESSSLLTARLVLLLAERWSGCHLPVDGLPEHYAANEQRQPQRRQAQPCGAADAKSLHARVARRRHQLLVSPGPQRRQATCRSAPIIRRLIGTTEQKQGRAVEAESLAFARQVINLTLYQAQLMTLAGGD